MYYGSFVLPESLLKENRRAFEWKRANPVGSLMNIRRYPIISGLAVSFFLIYIAAHAVQSNWAYYTMYKFNWSSLMVGISLSVVGVLVAIVQGALIRITIPKLGEKNSVYTGLALYVAGMLLFAFASQGWMMFVFLVPYCLGGIAGPSLQAVISGHVPPDQQGLLQGSLTSLMSLSTVFGPLVMTNTFYYFTSSKAPFYLPGIHFLIGAACMLVSVFIISKVLNKEKKQDPALPSTS